MRHEIPPAIRRDWTKADSDAKIEHIVHDKSEFIRGMGDTGMKVEHVSYICPCCNHDEMIRLKHLNPADNHTVEYWCLMPNCRYFVADELSWATKPHPNFTPDVPEIWDQTVVCPECGDRYTVTAERNGKVHCLIDNTPVGDGRGASPASQHQDVGEDDEIPESPCDECIIGNIPER